MATDNLGVPLILAGPGLAPTTREDAVQNHRVGATLLELADVRAMVPGPFLLEPAPGSRSSLSPPGPRRPAWRSVPGS